MEKRKNKPATGGDGRDKPKKATKLGVTRAKPLPVLVAKDPSPQPKIKHQVFLERVENPEKKKQLDMKDTTDTEPPPGYTFLPIVGNSELTLLCNDLSREQGAMIFRVSTSKDDTSELSLHTCRIGYHFRETIVEQARVTLGYRPIRHNTATQGVPEPIPETQEEINAQADAALRELFPRIPNTDRQEIVDRAFKKGKVSNGGPVVGLCSDLTLSRRVQLAVLAHIRHRHTRYDTLLKQTTWEHARKTVEAVCLDIIVKWRGDEENGRDQLDTILREVVVISDSEDDDEETEEDSDVPVIVSPRVADPARKAARALERSEAGIASLSIDGRAARVREATTSRHTTPKVPTTPTRTKGNARLGKRDRKAAKKAQRGFSRYQAAWDEAMERRRHEEQVEHPPQGAPLARSTSNGRFPATSLDYSPVGSPYAAHPTRANNEVIYLGPARRAGVTNTNPPPFDGRPSAPKNQYSPSMRAPRTVYLDEMRSPPPQVMTRGYTNPVHPSQHHPEPHYPDLLVRSIEAPNPVSMAPRFVRTLPARKHTRDESPDAYGRRDHPTAQGYHPNPSTEAIQRRQYKRRRVISDYEGVESAPLGVYPQDAHPRYTPEPNHRVAQPRYPPTYAPLDGELPMREGSRVKKLHYELPPERAGPRDQPFFVQPPATASQYNGELVQVQRAAPEAWQYSDRHAATTETPTILRYPTMGAAPGHPVFQSTAPPRYEDSSYRPNQGSSHQAPRLPMQPIFVRRVERRTPELRTQDPLHEPRGDGSVAPRRQQLKSEYYPSQQTGAVYADPRHSLSHSGPYGHSTFRNQVQPHEPTTADSHPQQPARLSYPHHNRPLAARDIIVLD
ncbi:hypothetical protein jhhlp_001443 [Lomentospora prolificans]|uniref:DUF2293 domain-containing protein n=1 Tax=Lomentospora prolificans TaxID=41688 RepID=A0A2N3NI88_9PEZI|nr:hypothetical protein jhhlp_001443 [Lomentospora prolificans]